MNSLTMLATALALMTWTLPISESYRLLCIGVILIYFSLLLKKRETQEWESRAKHPDRRE